MFSFLSLTCSTYPVPTSNLMQKVSFLLSQMLSITMEEQQEPTKLIHGSKEKHNKAMHMHTTPNPNPSQTIMRLASLAISSNVRLKSSDMPSHMQEHALRHTRSLFPLHHPPSPKPSNTLIARALKKV